MFKRSSVTPIFVVFLIVACFDGLFFARAANVVLDENNKEGNLVIQQGGFMEFTLVLGIPRNFYRDKTQPKKLTLDVGGCQVKIERESDTELNVADKKLAAGSIFGFRIRDDGTLSVLDVDNKAEVICQTTPVNIDNANAPEQSVSIKLEDDIAPQLFLYADDIRLPGVTTVPPSTSTDASSTTLATTDASSPSSEGLSGLVYIAIGAASGLVAALVIVGIAALICCLVKKKRPAEKVVVKDVSMRTEKTKETTVGGEKSAFKDVTDNKSAYGTSVVGPSPVTPSLL